MAEQVTRYRYLFGFKSWQDGVYDGGGRVTLETPLPIADGARLESIERRLQSTKPNYHVTITNYQLMARLIDGEWVSADA